MPLSMIRYGLVKIANINAGNGIRLDIGAGMASKIIVHPLGVR